MLINHSTLQGTSLSMVWWLVNYACRSLLVVLFWMRCLKLFPRLRLINNNSQNSKGIFYLGTVRKRHLPTFSFCLTIFWKMIIIIFCLCKIWSFLLRDNYFILTATSYKHVNCAIWSHLEFYQNICNGYKHQYLLWLYSTIILVWTQPISFRSGHRKFIWMRSVKGLQFIFTIKMVDLVVSC